MRAATILVRDSVSSPITKRPYNMALDGFAAGTIGSRAAGFCKAVVSARRESLEDRGLGTSSIIVRMPAIRKLEVEAADNGLAPELTAGIQRVKSPKSIGACRGPGLNQKQAQPLRQVDHLSSPPALDPRQRKILRALRAPRCPAIVECTCPLNGALRVPSFAVLHRYQRLALPPYSGQTMC